MMYHYTHTMSLLSSLTLSQVLLSELIIAQPSLSVIHTKEHSREMSQVSSLFTALEIK